MLGTHGHLRFQHAPDVRARREVGIADDAGRDPGLAVETRGGHRRDTVGELHLAHILHLLRPIGAVHREMLDEHRGDDVVAAVDVVQDLVQQVALLDASLPAIPQVMVRVADREIRLERVFADECEPVVVLASPGHQVVSQVNSCGLRPAAWCSFTFTSAGPLNSIASSSALCRSLGS